MLAACEIHSGLRGSRSFRTDADLELALRLAFSCLSAFSSAAIASFAARFAKSISSAPWQLLCDGKVYLLFAANRSGRPVLTG